MATICFPGRAMPEYVVAQEDLLTTLHRHYAGLDKLELKLQLASNTTVERRYFATPLDRMLVHEGVAQRMEHYIREATPLAISAITQALEHAQLTAFDISLFVLTSCTIPGVLLPGLDAYIVNHMDLPFHIRRLPIAQMGCHAGVTSMAVAHDYLLGHPSKYVLVCNIELCSLNEQPDDTNVSTFVSRGLFGDGAYAAVIRGDDRANGLRLLATNQYLVPDTIPHIQYRVDEKGNHFDTNREVLLGVKNGFPAVHTFLATHGYHPSDLEFLVCHSGGPRVMDLVIDDLGIDEHLIAASRESLREVGNLSSATVLDVLCRTFKQYRPHDGALGLVLGFGPGTTIEMALARWQDL